jgi:hypothetical protein
MILTKLGFLPVAVVGRVVHKYKINYCTSVHGEKQYTEQHRTHKKKSKHTKQEKSKNE